MDEEGDEDEVDYLVVVTMVVTATYAAAIAAYHTAQRRSQHYRPPGVITTLPEPYRGAIETQMILTGPPEYCFDTTRLRQPVLHRLIDKLVTDYGLTGRDVSPAEQVIIFLDHVAHRKTHRQLRRTYQHSLRTTTRCIKRVSKLLVRLYSEVVKLPPNETYAELRNNTKAYPYLKGCVGAIDGTHILVKLRSTAAGAFRDRHRDLSQNVFAAYDFDMNFVHVVAGYEGSANDSTVLKKAKQKGFTAAPGYYYLADGGYSKNDKLVLVPYQKTRYHLREFKASKQRPRTKQELFNLRHAQFRNAVERLFGIMKLRWLILREGPNRGYDFRMQCRFVYALAALHNFINMNGQPLDEEPYDWQPADEDVGFIDHEGVDEAVDEGVGVGQVRFRASIAQAMWDDYVALQRDEPWRFVDD